MTAHRGDSPWLRNFFPAPRAPVRLVCLAHAGGSASFYFPVARALSPRIEVLAVQYPGRQDRRGESAIGDLDVLAERIVQALEPWTDKPYALFGHSMGAIVGFEAARRLQSAGRGPSRLFVSGRRAPSLDTAGEYQPVTDEEVLTEITRLDGTGRELLEDQETLRMILPALRADYGAVRRYRYRPGPALACPITAFTGDRDPKATAGQVRAWQAHTTSAFELNVLPGGHFFLVGEQQRVLSTVSRQLGCAAPSAVVS